MATQTNRARPFLIAIGIFYLANLLGTLHFSSLRLFGMMYSGVDLQVGAPVFTLLQDAWAVVGLQLGAIGLVALWGARQPVRFMAVVPVVRGHRHGSARRYLGLVQHRLESRGHVVRAPDVRHPRGVDRLGVTGMARVVSPVIWLNRPNLLNLWA